MAKQIKSDERCKARVRGDGWYGHLCSNRAVKDGYCMVHHPDKVKERRAKSDAKFEAQWAADKKRWAEQEHRQKDLEDRATRCTNAERKLATLAGKVNGIAQAMLTVGGSVSSDMVFRWANDMLALIDFQQIKGNKK